MGYGGNGITFSQIASEIVASALAGLDDTDARLFAFDRVDSEQSNNTAIHPIVSLR